MKEQILLSSVSNEDLRAIIVDAIKEAIPTLETTVKGDDPDKLLGRLEAAEFMNISISSLNNYAKQGIIKKYKIGSKVLYDKKELIEAVKNRESEKLGKRVR